MKICLLQCKLFFFFCREALAEIFDRCDLDDNGYLSREEFDSFQLKSAGEQCDDDAWEIMKGSVSYLLSSAESNKNKY